MQSNLNLALGAAWGNEPILWDAYLLYMVRMHAWMMGRPA
jgi:hypothetical protein